MKKALIIIAVAIVVLVGGFYALNAYIYNEKQGDNPTPPPAPVSMPLTIKTWTWASAQFEDGRTLSPAKPDAFTLTFADDSTFSATTDCNGLSGAYITSDDEITFSQIAMTKMFCEGSQEMEFLRLLEDAKTFHITPGGELVLGLKFDSGTVTFR